MSPMQSAGSRQSTSTTGTALTTSTAATNSTVITSPSDCEGGPRAPGLLVSNLSASIPPAPRSPSARSSITSILAQPAKRKKKPWFLGTLFAKEASTDAFLQMQNQSRKQMAQNPGQKNPPGMSSVSSAKMPEHVPKVNSKWDGMPCKVTEDSDGASLRSDFRRYSTRAPSNCSRSAKSGGRRSHSKKLSDSTTNSKPLEQRRMGMSSHIDESRGGSGGLESSAESVSSSNSIKHPRSKSMSIRTKSLQSPSGSSLPQITSFFPHEIPEPPSVPQIYRVHPLSRDSGQVPVEEPGKRDVPQSVEPRVEPLSDHMSSSSVAPPEQSPITPLSELLSVQHLDSPIANIDDSISFPATNLKLTEVNLRSPESDVLRPPVASRKVSADSGRAFLAREARPLQLPDEEWTSLTPNPMLKKKTKGEVFAPAVHIQQDLERRPDSSRARLGLRASMIRSADAVPWEWDKETDPQSDALDRGTPSRNRFSKSFGVFGKV